MFGRRRRGPRGLRRGWLRRLGRGLRWGLRVVLLLLIIDLFYLAVTWPDWKKLATGPVPKSAFMRDYETLRAADKRLPPLRWQPVPFASIPKTVIRAVILAEDSRFYEHSGFDLIAFKEAMDYNWKERRLVLGASTISQQTVKNLFLSPSRNPLRKWHELVLTWGMEHHLTKRRILDLYLNIAQFGQGIYGVQAAAQAYWGIPAEQLTPAQAADLAASLPSPVKNNPATHTRYFERRANKILSLLERYPGEAAASVRERPIELLAPPPENDSEPPPAAPGPQESSPPPAPSEGQALPPVEDRSIRRLSP
jgi:monofunctional biosynthetic peptidoglycan transglycosylase